MGLGGLLARPSRLPLRRPSHELLLLALVAFVALSPVNHASDPDASRLCLSRASRWLRLPPIFFAEYTGGCCRNVPRNSSSARSTASRAGKGPACGAPTV